MHFTMLIMMMLAMMLAPAMSTVTTPVPGLTEVSAKLTEVNKKLAALTANLAKANTSINHLRNSNYYQGGEIIKYWLKGNEYTEELVEPIEMYTLTNNRRVKNLEYMVYISVTLIVVTIIIALVITHPQRQQLRPEMETVGDSNNEQEPRHVPTREEMEARL